MSEFLSKPINIKIRADATSRTGSGHVMRCMALAQWAKIMGIPVEMAGYVTIPWVMSRLIRENINFTPLESITSPWPISNPPTGDDTWGVLDGYHFTLETQEKIRLAGFKLLVIDDYCHLPSYSCDLLLNQNFGSASFQYHGEIGNTLCEPYFALLRPEFAAAGPSNGEFPKIRRLILNLGGGDSSEFLQNVAGVFEKVCLEGYRLDIIAGAIPPDAIHAAFANVDAEIHMARDITDMPSFLSGALLGISACGSTCWEFCALGIPFLAFSIAENQDNIFHNFIERYLALPFTSSNLRQLLSSTHLRHQYANRVSSLVSRDGAAKILKILSGESYSIQPACQGDSDSILRIINNPELRATATSPAPVEKIEHESWLKKRLQENLPFFVAKNEKGELLGYARFYSLKNNEVSISIALYHYAQGKGIGTALTKTILKILWNFNPGFIVKAFIRTENTQSKSFFKKLGFIHKPASLDHAHDCLIWEADANILKNMEISSNGE